MSGRRRRDDGWDHDGQVDAPNEWNAGRVDRGRDPWADSAVEEEWGYQARRGAGAYVGDDATRNGQAAPAFPSFQAADGRGQASRAGGYDPARRGGDQHGAGSGYGGDGYQDSGYGRMANGGSRRDAAAPGGRRNGSGYNGSGQADGPAYAPELTPADNADIEEDGSAGTPRPYGRLSIFTLHDDKAREFDRLAERAAEGVRTAEPDTLVYVIHVVPKAPMQRLIYEIYRDRAAFLTHERQPHIRQFAADRASCVLATNIIDLRLKYAKVGTLGSPSEPPMPPQAHQMPRTGEPAAGSDRRPAAGPRPTAQHQPDHAATQTSRTQSQRPAAASFTPAADRYVDTGQPTVGREAYPPASQYGGDGTGGYGAGNGQYGAANVHSRAAGYANGGSYPSANRYQSPNGNSAGNGYADVGGYSAANGYSNGTSYQNDSRYADRNGNSAADGYSNGAGYRNGEGYGAASGYAGGGAETPGPQYTPRYRELTSGTSDGGAGGQPDKDRPADGGRQSNQPKTGERVPRSSDQR